MTKKSKKRIRGKAPATLKDVAPAAPAPKKEKEKKERGPTKMDQVRALCERASGVSLAEIVEKLDVSKSAAASLVGDLRRKGVNVKLVDGVYRI